MNVSRHDLRLIRIAALLLLVTVVVAQESSLSPETKPEPLYIPAIPGIPTRGEPRPSRKAPRFPGAPGPGVVVPGMVETTAGRAEQLQPEFQPGNTYRFVVKTELQTRTEAGAPGGFTMEQQARFDAKVRVDGKSGIVLKARTERLDVTLQSGATTLAYQSLRPEDQETPLGRHLRASLNRSVDLTLDERGRVDASQEGGTGDEGALLPGVPRFGPEELVQLIASLPQGFPEKRVGPGEQWRLQGSRSVGGAGVVNFDLTYHHAGQVNFEGHSCVSVEFAGGLAGSLPGEGAVSSDFQASGIRGRLYFDPLDHMVRFGEQSIDLWITRPATEDLPGAQIPVRQMTTVRLLHVVPTP